jgi:hypothetical protein
MCRAWIICAVSYVSADEVAHVPGLRIILFPSDGTLQCIPHRTLPMLYANWNKHAAMFHDPDRPEYSLDQISLGPVKAPVRGTPGRGSLRHAAKFVLGDTTGVDRKRTGNAQRNLRNLATENPDAYSAWLETQAGRSSRPMDTIPAASRLDRLAIEGGFTAIQDVPPPPVPPHVPRRR